VEHREIGGTGIRASRVGLGTWAIGGWMWGGMRAAVPAAAQIGTLVNAHSNPDHTNGNQLVVGAQISRRYLEDGDEITFKARARREG